MNVRKWEGVKVRGVLQEGVEQGADGFVQARVDEVGGNFGQGLEDETAFVETGMGEGEAGFVDYLAAVEEEIEVDEARLPADAADAAHVGFDLEEDIEQVSRRESGFDGDDGIQIRRGIGGAADGGGFDGSGFMCDFDAGDLRQARDGRCEIGGAVAEV